VTKIGDRILPLAWDVEDAELRLLAADGRETVLASFRETPYSVVMFSAATDGPVEAPLVLFEPRKPRGYLGWKEEDFTDRPIRGACVFFEVRPDAALLEELIRRGAVAFITDGYGPKTGHHRCQPDATRWINDAFGEGMIHRRRKTIPGFSVTPRTGGGLRDRLRAGESLRVRFSVRSRTFDGEFNMVRAALPGAAKPDERVLLLAHLFEPNISNDCSGVAIIAEAAAVLRRLTHQGLLAPPARTIELFSSWEMFGVAAYGVEDPELRRNGVAALAADCLVRKDSPAGKERITLYPTPRSSPSFVNGLLNLLLDHFAGRTGLHWSEGVGFTSNENMLADPTLGPPTALLQGELQFEDGSYHTDADTPDKLDPDRMAHVAALVGTAAYVVASASDKDCAWLADAAADRARRTLSELVERGLQGAVDCPHERLAMLAEIEQQAVASTTRICDSRAARDGVAERRRSLEGFAAEQDRRLGARAAVAKNETLWREARAVTPVRTIPGPFSFQDVSAEFKATFQEEVGLSAQSFEWTGCAPNIFWADGQRSVADVCKCSQLDAPTLYNDKALATMLKLFRFLDRNGYIRLVGAE